jgi:hypothetical protein
MQAERGTSMLESCTSTGFVANVFSRYTSSIVTMSVSDVMEIDGPATKLRRARDRLFRGAAARAWSGHPG